MKETLTAVFEQPQQEYIGYVKEFPGVNAQRRILQEAKENLAEAIQLVLQANQKLGNVQTNLTSAGHSQIFVYCVSLNTSNNFVQYIEQNRSIRYHPRP